MNVYDRMVARIDRTLPRIPQDSQDRSVLSYIRSQLLPERLQWREENDHGDVSHLLSVAKSRLRDHEVREVSE